MVWHYKASASCRWPSRPRYPPAAHRSRNFRSPPGCPRASCRGHFLSPAKPGLPREARNEAQQINRHDHWADLMRPSEKLDCLTPVHERFLDRKPTSWFGRPSRPGPAVAAILVEVPSTGILPEADFADFSSRPAFVIEKCAYGIVPRDARRPVHSDLKSHMRADRIGHCGMYLWAHRRNGIALTAKLATTALRNSRHPSIGSPRLGLALLPPTAGPMATAIVWF